MKPLSVNIPVVLFTYARRSHLARVLASGKRRALRLEVFADGARGANDAPRVAEVRALIRAIDLCDVRLTERRANVGLGRNVLAGVGEEADRHEAFIVWEDDLRRGPWYIPFANALAARLFLRGETDSIHS